MKAHHKELELPSGEKIIIKKPGQLAYMQTLGILPTKEYMEVRAQIAAGKSRDEAAAAIRIDPLRAAEATVRFVCACTVKPRLTADLPVPKDMMYFDDYTKEDWDVIVEGVEALRQEAEAETNPTESSSTEQS